MERAPQPYKKSWFTLSTGIFWIQVLDIVIHMVSNQVEVIRISSNVIMMLWVLSQAYTPGSLPRVLSIGVLIVYLGLNLIFIIQVGVLNSYGGYRILFFILVITTSLLSMLLIRKTNA